MKHLRYAIEYEYPGTVGGGPVGRVFAQRIDHITRVADTWSYTRVAKDATLFDTEDEARRVASVHSWPAVKFVGVGIDGTNDEASAHVPECPSCGAAPGQAHDPTCQQANP